MKTSGMIVYTFTDRFDEMKKLYEAALGVKGEAGGPDWVSFNLGDSIFGLHRQVKPPQDAKAFHLDFLVDDIAAALKRFEEAGVKVVRGIQDEAFGKSAIVRDPEEREFMIVQTGV
jgi:predicted enzyme related to lactoylglutathione lyase